MRSNSKKAWLAALLVLASGISACLTLTPIRAIYRVNLTPLQQGDDYQVDNADDGIVFVKEGLRLKVRHLQDGELNAHYPDESNPFTYRGEVDPALGHVPPRFTVFQVLLNNPTFDKVLMQPERVFLKTDRGKILHPYQLTRAEARGDVRNFETYWLSRGVQSGNMQKLYLERMGVLRGAVYHRDSFVFKGNSYRGMLIFDPLEPGTGQVTLFIADFVLDFGIYDTPGSQVDLEFTFAVRGEVIEPVAEMAQAF
ncbi:MAG TPA: hypothetical protein EYG11_12575 [Candidatus Latescibacteria bacterium]|nr:hypothetical protein [Candidatus Handelsmanbacteria bacterium]HIL09528.1 hypothetical protein [Candidatus Latescibacterota bacterium]